MVEIVSQWVTNGTAEKLSALQSREAAFRQEMAGDILLKQTFKADPYGFHVWLSLPSPWGTHDFCRVTDDQGVKLAPGSLFAMDGRKDPCAVRISLSHEPDQERVRQGLMILATILQTKNPQDRLVI